MAKETDPKPTPKCALCKGEHTAWSNACPRRRREQARIELARKARPTFHYESDEPRPITLKTPASGNGGEVPVPSEGGGKTATLTSTPTPSAFPSQSHPYDLRRNIQPSTRLAEGEWQTHRRRRTRSPQKSSQRDRSRSPDVRQTRPALTERSANASLGRREARGKPVENVQTIENFFQLTPSQQ
jgi:hypothetical protein